MGGIVFNVILVLVVSIIYVGILGIPVVLYFAIFYENDTTGYSTYTKVGVGQKPTIEKDILGEDS